MISTMAACRLKKTYLSRVCSFGCSKTNKFGPSKGECSSHKDTAEPLEAVVESPWVVPVLPSNVPSLRTSTTDQNHAENDESNHGDDLDDCKDVLRLCVTLDAEEVDGDDDDQKNADPSVVVDSSVVPKVDREGCRNDLKWQHYKPLHGVVPAHCKTPRRIQKASRVCGEGARHRIKNGHFTQSVNRAV